MQHFPVSPTHVKVTKMEEAEFSHVKATAGEYRKGGLRDFFVYRDLGIADATDGRVVAQLVRANLAPEEGAGWHVHGADFTSFTC